MANNNLAVIELLWQIVNQETGELGRVDFLPEKPAYDLKAEISRPLPRSTPEEQGVDSAYLAEFVKEIGNEKSVHIHQVMVVRHGHVIYEGGFDPYPCGVWHVSYSMCKSFTGMAIGLLIDDGKLKLTDHLTDILNTEWEQSHPPLLSVLRFKEITIRDLLTMSTGVAFNEAGAVTGNDWVKNYFESSVKFQPGTRFEYNSMNSFMLSAVVTKLTGRTMFDFLKERLFEPMGIDKVFWENSPKGLTKGGWGMFLTEEDAAKLGLLYLNDGSYNGEQLISSEWVHEATSPQRETGLADNPQYGYHLWMDSRPESFIYNGMLGQNVHCYRDIDMIVVTNAGDPEVFQGGVMSGIMRKYFGPGYEPSAEALPDNPESLHRLEHVKRSFERPHTVTRSIVNGGWGRPSERNHRAIRIQRLLKEIDGREFVMDETGVGLFPLIMQVVHNNYTHGIKSLSFRMVKGNLQLEFREGAQTHILPVGFGAGHHTAINMNGEEYLVGTKGHFAFNEDNLIVLDLQIAFIEEATERWLKIVFRDPCHIDLHWSESPGDLIITDTVEQITVGSGNSGFLMENLMKNVNPKLIYRIIQNAICPTVSAKYVPEENTEAILPEAKTEAAADK